MTYRDPEDQIRHHAPAGPWNDAPTSAGQLVLDFVRGGRALGVLSDRGGRRATRRYLCTCCLHLRERPGTRPGSPPQGVRLFLHHSRPLAAKQFTTWLQGRNAA